MLTIYNGERAYSFSNNGQYYDVPESAAPDLDWRTVYMDDPNLGGIPVVFTVTVVGATFSARAQRNPPVLSPCFATINQNRVVAVSAQWTAGTC